MDMNEFRAWRDRMGFSQRQAAEALGVSPGTINAAEAGKRPIEPMMGYACRWIEYEATANAPSPDDDPRDEQPADHGGPAWRQSVEDRFDALEALSLEARLNALEAKLTAFRPRLAPDVQALQDKEDADHAAMLARSAAKRAELEAQEAEEPEAVIGQPWNTYRPPQLTPEQEAARKAARAAAKAAHLATGEPWD